MSVVGVAAGEHGLLEARLDDVALDAEELRRPGPRLHGGELVVGDAVVRVARVPALLFEARRRPACVTGM